MPSRRKSSRHSISFGSEIIAFTLNYSTRRNLGITVRPDQSVLVVAPKGKDIEIIRARVKKRAQWILRQQRYFEPFLPPLTQRRYVSGETHFYLGKQYRLKVRKSVSEGVKLIGRFIHVGVIGRSSARRVKELLDDWLLAHALVRFQLSLDGCVEKLNRWGVPRPALRIRRMKRRWGSCTNRAIYLNSELIKAPSHCIDYVVMHELCHVKYRGHNKRFYELLSKVMPDWQKRKARLERVSACFLSSGSIKPGAL